MKQKLLNQTSDHSFFKVPENYFSDFEVKMNERIDAFEAQQRISVPKKGIVLFMNAYKPILNMASMFVLLLFSVAMIMHYSVGKSNTNFLKAQTVTKELPIPTAEDYLISNMGTYSISQYYIESEMTD